MADDVPESGGAGKVVVLPGDWCLLAELLEHLVVLEALEAVEVEKVDSLGYDGTHGSPW